MYRSSWWSVALVVAVGLAACGDGGSDDDGADAAAAPDDAAPAPPDAAPPAPLEITGTVTVENPGNTLNNALVRVYLAIRIEQDGAPVDTAVIKVNPPGAFQTYLTGEPLDPSLYTGDYMGYNNDTVRLEITAGGHEIPETVLVGTSLFQVTAPTAGTMVDATSELTVTWSRPGVASDFLVVSADDGGDGVDYDSGELTDADAHTIPAGALTAGAAYDLRVYRAKRNTLPDTTAGSGIDFGVASYVSIETQP